MIEREKAISLLSTLVRIPSVNPRIGGGDGEGALAAFLADYLGQLGLSPEVSEVQPGRPNVLATAPGLPGGRHLLFEAHLDTVPPSSGQAEPFTPRLEGDRLYGRGACDTKAAIAGMLLALEEALAAVNRIPTVTVAFTMGEELGHEGARQLASGGIRVDGAVVGEPTGLDIIAAHKGVLRWRMRVTGISAHSSAPERGINAIGRMAVLIRAIEDRLLPALAVRPHPVLGPPTLSIGRIAGGTGINVVPDRCTIDLGRRLLPGESWVDVEEEIQDLVVEACQELLGGDVQIEAPYQQTPGMETAPDHPLVRLTEEAVRRVDGHHPVRGVAYCTDASDLALAGIPCVVLGPGHIDQAHTAAEYVEIQQVLKAAAIYRELMLVR